jgi:Family of unknown function (DUF6581)
VLIGRTGLTFEHVFARALSEHEAGGTIASTLWLHLRNRKDLFYINADGEQVILRDSPFAKVFYRDLNKVDACTETIYYERLQPAGSKRKAADRLEEPKAKRRSPDRDNDPPEILVRAQSATPPVPAARSYYVLTPDDIARQQAYLVKQAAELAAIAQYKKDEFENWARAITAKYGSVYNSNATTYQSPYGSAPITQPTTDQPPYLTMQSPSYYLPVPSMTTYPPNSQPLYATEYTSPYAPSMHDQNVAAISADGLGAHMPVPPENPPNWTEILSHQPTTRVSKTTQRKRRKRRSSSQQSPPPAKQTVTELMDVDEVDEQTGETPKLQPVHFARKGRSRHPSPEEPAEKKLRLDKAEELSRAAAVTVNNLPDNAAFLPCIFRGDGGNLIISKDVTKLEFYPTVPTETNDPILCLLTSKIIGGDVVLSTNGSNPMELSFKAGDNNKNAARYSFIFAFDGMPSGAAVLMRVHIIKGWHNHMVNGPTDAEADGEDEFGGVEDLPNPEEVQREMGVSQSNENVAASGGAVGNAPKSSSKATKDFRCAKCGNVYKQVDGLVYHLTKSVTPCNPKADLKLYHERKARAEIRKKGKKALRREASENDATLDRSTTLEVAGPSDEQQPVKPKQGRPRKQTTETVHAEPDAAGPSNQFELPDLEALNLRSPVRTRKPKKGALARSEEPEQFDGSDTEDSVIKFFEKHSTSGVERPRKVPSAEAPKAPVKRSYKSLPYELPVLRELAQQIADSEIGKNVNPEVPISFELVNESEKEISQRSEKTLISIMNNNGGVFPGDKSIWIAFAFEWFKKFPGSDVLPESKLCAKTVDHLIASKKFRPMEVVWVDDRKREVTRTLLTLVGSRISSEAIGTLKKLIQEVYPDFYVPSFFAPPKAILSRMNALATRKLPDKDRFRLQETIDLEEVVESQSHTQSPALLDESSDDEFVAGEADEAEPLDDDEVDDEADWEDDEQNLEETEKSKKPSKKSKRPGTKNGDKFTRVRSPSHNKAISEGVRRNWATRKATKTDDFFPNRKNKKQRIPLTQDEKDRRANMAYERLHGWSAAPAYIPNPVTGAWDISSVPKPKRGGRRTFKPKMPFPITYMQASNGSWSFQPLGHGAKPIFARPSRRADAEGTYVKRTGRDHRPVIFPTKNQKFLPAMPTKARLGQTVAPEQRASTEISKRTGMPKRKYVRRKPLPATRGSKVSPGYRASKKVQKKRRPYLRRFATFIPVHYAMTNVERNRRDRRKAISEVDLLNFFEPKKLTADAPRNPGLYSLPPAFGFVKSLYLGPGPEVHEFLPKYSHIKLVTPKVINGGDDPKHGSWTVNVWQPVSSGIVPLRWNSELAFDMQTLPYDELDFGKSEDLAAEKARPKRGKPGYKMIPRSKITLQDRHKFPRTLVHLPDDVEGLFSSLSLVFKKLGIEVAQPNRAAQHNRRIKGANAILSADTERRLALAVTIIRSLTGGLDLRIDWVLISQVFQDYTQNFLMKYWKSFQSQNSEVLDTLMDEFQDNYLSAYGRKEVPRTNFHKVTRGGLRPKKLIKWAEENPEINTSMKLPSKDLPFLTRAALEANFDFEIVGPAPSAKDRRDVFYDSKTPHYRRMDSLHRAPHVATDMTAIQARKDSKKDEHCVLRSWLRATALTPKEVFDKKDAEKKLLQLASKATIKKVLAEMQLKNIMLKNSRDRRFMACHWEVSMACLNPLGKTANIQPEQFVDAAIFKEWVVDAKFWQGDESVFSDYFANTGQIMTALSLQASGQVRFEAEKDPSVGKKFGLIPGGGYETRNIDPLSVNFNVKMIPTESYVHDSQNAVLQKFLTREPPRPSGKYQDALPMWIDINGNVIRDIWLRCMCSLGSLLAMRAGLNVSSLAQHYRCTMAAWEIRLLLDWGVEGGLFVRMHPTIEGWMVSQDWFLMIGHMVNDGRPIGRGK